MQATWRRRMLMIMSIIVTIHFVMFYGLPNSIRIPVIVILVIIYLRTGPVAALATTISIGVASALCVLVIYLLGLDKAIYYRPFEILSQEDYEHGYRIGKKNTRIEMKQLHGDIGALKKVDLAPPRNIVFQTDSAGFRNDHDFRNGQIVLIGDSFVMGESVSQEDTLSNQLNRNYGISAYSLAYPGDIADYLKVWNAFREEHPAPLHGILFLYEGNDFDLEFDSEEPGKPSFLTRWHHRYRDIFSQSILYRVTKSLYARAKRSGSQKVLITDIEGLRLVYSEEYAKVCKRKQYKMPPAMVKDLIKLGSKVDHIYFIPTKYRVYAKHIGVNDLTDTQWNALSKICKQQAWKCTNLTPALIEESDNLLTKGEFTWWPDDTHWNKFGISVAARIVAKELGNDKNINMSSDIRPQIR